MKIIATVMLMASFVCGSFALSATDAQAHRSARPHRHVIIYERPGVRHRHATARHRRHAAHHRAVVRRHESRRVCKTVLYHHAWVKRCT